MFRVRKAHRWRSLVRAGQTRKLERQAVLFAVLETLLCSKVAWDPPSCLSGGSSLPCVATPVRRAFYSVRIINSALCEFFAVRLSEAPVVFHGGFSKSQRGFWLSFGSRLAAVI